VSSGSTIVAPATGPAPGGVGILRLSGPSALELAQPFAKGLPERLEPRRAYLVDFLDSGGAALDSGLFLFFQAPSSFTGEDVVELHLHGSPRLLALLQHELLSDGRARMAQPGEFSRRAYLNGRMDLTRAEAIADLVAAESEAAVRAAAAQLGGGLSARVRDLREPLLALHADLEGVLNFPEEAEGADDSLEPRLGSLVAAARDLVADAGRGRLVRRGAKVVLFGPVNAGKSTLFNRLLGEERALVDAEPGTTRDVLEARIELAGLGVTLVDTAGLRAEPGRLEALGMERARGALRSADLAVLILPPGALAGEAERWRGEAGAAPLIIALGKSDLRLGDPDPIEGLPVSGSTGAGIEELRRRILERLWGDRAPGAVALASERHLDALRRAAGSLERALEGARASTLEVVAGEIGLALEAVGEITGESASADLLDAIFRRFCVGK
jgi:tRNA modification GTPase